MYFAKDIGKSLSSKYSQKPLDSAKKSMTDAIKTASKRAIQKIAEVTGNLIGNKTADKITNVSKISSQNVLNADERSKYKKKDIYLQKKDTKLLMN